jgi:prefoldin subunit 5
MIDQYEQIQWLQEQIWTLQRNVEQLQMENTLLRNDLNTLKTEGCWRFVEDVNHEHRGVK